MIPDIIGGCKQLNITHLRFADDLLVLCHGDLTSAMIVKKALDHFCSISGLNPNIGKSTLFFRNLKYQVKQEILSILPFKVGSFPITYLGVPLISKQIGIKDCKRLLDKVKDKVLNWKNKMLTYTGRLQLIASVLSAIHNGKAKVSWKMVCIPKCQGGLGLKDLGLWNEILMSKHLWNIACDKKSVWVKWINEVRLKGQSIWQIETDPNTTVGWKHILPLRGTISDVIPIEENKKVSLDLNIKVCDMIENGEWKWPKD
nr:RNA-directed DNA polymerase, eukaryota, reverse transcriptase zinc-binding domain protein [Tanacetum cinerariifolium]